MRNGPYARSWDQNSAGFLESTLRFTRCFHILLLIHPQDSPWPLSQLCGHHGQRLRGVNGLCQGSKPRPPTPSLEHGPQALGLTL